MTACSMMRLRRLEAGELGPEERDALLLHAASCDRCTALRRELQEERARLRADVPFEAFAAGIEQKLPRSVPRANRFVRVVAPLAAAASIAVVAGIALRPHDEPREQIKGTARIELFVQDRGGVHAVAPGEKLARDARILPALHGIAGRRMVVTLVEPGESTVLFDGPAKDGTLPQAFEWTGEGTALLRVDVDGASVTEVTLSR